MNIQFIIMAHKDRRRFIPYLKQRLGDVPVSMDNGDLGLVDAHIQAWEMVDREADYGFIIQDDVLLADNFLEKAEYHVHNGLERYGAIPLHFYLRNSPRFNGRIEQWKRSDRDHVLLPNLYSGNSIGLPTYMIDPMLAHFKAMDVASGDERINSYIKSRGLEVYFPLPNLCQHRNIPSLHNRNSSPLDTRVSIWYEG